MPKTMPKRSLKLLSADTEAQFLLEAGDILSSSLEFQKTLASVAKMIVPQLADWFSIYLLDEAGNLTIPVTAHADPEKVQWARELQKKYPVDMNATEGAPAVIRTGKPEIMEEVSMKYIREKVKDPERLKLLDALDLKSFVTVPLIVHKKTLGALSLVMAGSPRRYQQKDLVFAQRLARRIASAIDNSRLYEALEKEVIVRRSAEARLEIIHSELEQRVAERTKELVSEMEFSETLLQAQSDLGDGVAVIDGTTPRLMYVNQALCDIYGYTREELLALPSLLVLVPPEDLPWFKKQLKDRLRGVNTTDHYEVTTNHRNGARVSIAVAVKQLKDAEKPTFIVIIRDITSRKVAEAALRAQEKRLSEAQQIAQTGSWQWDLKTDRITLSDEMFRIYGLKKSPFVIYDDFLSYVHPQDREAVNKTLQKAFEARKPFRFDYRIIRADGQERDIHGRGEFTIDARGTITGMFGTGQDITDRKNIEESLLKWQHIFDHARWGLIVGSPDGKRLEMLNPALSAMFGYSVEELIGKPVEFLLTPSVRKAHAANVDIIRAQGYHLWETTCRRKDGTEFPVQVDLTVVKNDAGKPLYYVGSVRDMTQQKIAERALQRSQEELEVRVEERTAELEEAVIQIEQERAKDEALLDSIGDAIIAVDKEGRVMFVNRITEMMYGISQKEMLGKSSSNILPLADASERAVTLSEQPLGVALRSGKRITGNFYYAIRPNGTKLPIGISAAPIILDDKVIGAIGVYRDMTREREIDRAKSEFVSLASHQLRTPLTITSWYTEKLIDQDPAGQTVEEKKYLDQLYRANRRMIDLVNALLDVSRIELGTLLIELAETDFRQVADSVLEELMPQITSKQLRITRQYDAKFPRIKVDQKLLRIIFQNLLSNATKYNNPGGEITIKITKQKDEALITVSDTGFGIPAHQQEKLFTKLFRADNAREKESDGTGLGLYIVKSILNQAGGRVWFESFEGKGSTFHATLPLKGMHKKVVKS